MIQWQPPGRQALGSQAVGLQRFALFWNVVDSEQQKSQKLPLYPREMRASAPARPPSSCSPRPYSGEGPGVRADCSPRLSISASPLHLSSFISHPSSLIPHLSSLIFHPSSFIWYSDSKRAASLAVIRGVPTVQPGPGGQPPEPWTALSIHTFRFCAGGVRATKCGMGLAARIPGVGSGRG